MWKIVSGFLLSRKRVISVALLMALCFIYHVSWRLGVQNPTHGKPAGRALGRRSVAPWCGPCTLNGLRLARQVPLLHHGLK